MKRFIKGLMAFSLAFAMCVSAPVFAAGVKGHPAPPVMTKQLQVAEQSPSRVMTVKTTQDQQRRDPAREGCPPCNENQAPRAPQVMGTW